MYLRTQVNMIALPALPLGGVWPELGRMSFGVHPTHIALRPIVFLPFQKFFVSLDGLELGFSPF